MCFSKVWICIVKHINQMTDRISFDLDRRMFDDDENEQYMEIRASVGSNDTNTGE